MTNGNNDNNSDKDSVTSYSSDNVNDTNENNDNNSDRDSVTSYSSDNDNDLLESDEEENEELVEETNRGSTAKYNVVHAPAILGDRIYISKKPVGGSSFGNSNASDQWDDPAVLPADLSLGISASQSEVWETSGAADLRAEPTVTPSDLRMGVCSPRSELWAEPAPIPSYLRDEMTPTNTTTSSRHDSSQPITPHQRQQLSAGTPTHLLSHCESFSRSLNLSLSPIQKTQELAWAPE